MKILFVCHYNVGRSQMAEAFLKKHGGESFEVESAGIEPGKLNPYVVRVMREIGIDISENKTTGVTEYLSAGTKFDYVITVCDETSAERCPVFPTVTTRLHFGFKDPSSIKGTDEYILQETAIIRDQIKKKIVEWIKEF